MKQRDSNNDRLINALAEHIKMPLTQISRRAELSSILNDAEAGLAEIEELADSTLKLLDDYLLSITLARSQDNLHLEPVSIAAVLTDAAHQLSKLAKQYQCELQLDISGKYEPVMAHRAGLEAALTSLGYVFIEAQSTKTNHSRSTVKLAAHRSRSGIVTGMFSDQVGLGAEVFKRGRGLIGRARQPLNQMSSTNGAGIFIADSLLRSMSSELKIARHHKMTGLAATLTPSRQMALV